MSRGQIVRWALEEVGADYQQVIINYGAEMKSSEYLAINPMGKVPAIKHGDCVVTECAAICAYLADVFEHVGLSPQTQQQKADYYRWLFFAAGPLESAVTNQSLQFQPAVEQQVMAGYGSYEQTVDVLEAMLSERDYICGEVFSAADIYVGSHVVWGLEFESLPVRDSFTAYRERLIERPAYQTAKAKDEALIEQAAS